MENLAYKNNNVVAINTSNLYSYIQLFLNSKSPNTKRSYSSYIDNFFMYVIGKHINEVTWEDITNNEKINPARAKQYQQYLKNEYTNGSKSLSAKTINIYITAIQSLFDELRAYNSNIDNNLFVAVKRLKEAENHYGEMSDSEIWNLIEYCKTESYEGKAKSVFFETLFATGLRKSATLNLTWDNISQQHDRKNKLNYWKITVDDKGKEVSFPIANELYDKLVSIKKKANNKIFTFAEAEARKTFDRYCRKYKIDKDKRNLSIHSIKHTGVLKTLEENGYDYELTKNYSHHSQTATLFNYTNKAVDITKSPTYNFYKTVDLSKLENASREDLLKAILSCPEFVKRLVADKIE